MDCKRVNDGTDFFIFLLLALNVELSVSMESICTFYLHLTLSTFFSSASLPLSQHPLTLYRPPTCQYPSSGRFTIFIIRASSPKHLTCSGWLSNVLLPDYSQGGAHHSDRCYLLLACTLHMTRSFTRSTQFKASRTIHSSCAGSLPVFSRQSSHACVLRSSVTDRSSAEAQHCVRTSSPVCLTDHPDHRAASLHPHPKTKTHTYSCSHTEGRKRPG